MDYFTKEDYVAVAKSALGIFEEQLKEQLDGGIRTDRAELFDIVRTLREMTRTDEEIKEQLEKQIIKAEREKQEIKEQQEMFKRNSGTK